MTIKPEDLKFLDQRHTYTNTNNITVLCFINLKLYIKLNSNQYTINNKSILFNYDLIIKESGKYNLRFVVCLKINNSNDLVVILKSNSLLLILVSNTKSNNLQFSLNVAQNIVVTKNNIYYIVSHKIINDNKQIIFKLYNLYTELIKQEILLYTLLFELIVLLLFLFIKQTVLPIDNRTLLSPNFNIPINKNKIISATNKLINLSDITNNKKYYKSITSHAGKHITSFDLIIRFSSALYRIHLFDLKYKLILKAYNSELIISTFDTLLYTIYFNDKSALSMPFNLSDLSRFNSQSVLYTSWLLNMLLLAKLFDLINYNKKIQRYFPNYLVLNNLEFNKLINVVSIIIDLLILTKINKTFIQIDLNKDILINKYILLYIKNILQVSDIGYTNTTADRYIFNYDIDSYYNYQPSDYTLSALTYKSVILNRLLKNSNYIIKHKGTIKCILIIANCFGLKKLLYTTKLLDDYFYLLYSIKDIALYYEFNSPFNINNIVRYILNYNISFILLINNYIPTDVIAIYGILLANLLIEIKKQLFADTIPLDNVTIIKKLNKQFNSLLLTLDTNIYEIINCNNSLNLQLYNSNVHIVNQNNTYSIFKTYNNIVNGKNNHKSTITTKLNTFNQDSPVVINYILNDSILVKKG